jgi:hypothetical protein
MLDKNLADEYTGAQSGKKWEEMLWMRSKATSGINSITLLMKRVGLVCPPGTGRSSAQVMTIS